MGAVFAERFNRTIRDLLNRPVFGKGDPNSFDILPTKTKQYNIRVHTSTKLTPIQPFFKKERRICLQKSKRQTKENKTKVSSKQSR